MTPDKIILHHSGGPDSEGNNTAGIRKWHVEHNGWSDVGYHALCEKVGSTYEIIMGRPWTMNGAHTIGQNDRAFGLCFVGNYNDAPPPDDMLRVAARFVAWWCRLFNIPTTEIYRHSAFAQTDCPGHAFDLERFQMMVEDY
jgi:N-acetylmuramoyl-L-alanine amidase